MVISPQRGEQPRSDIKVFMQKKKKVFIAKCIAPGSLKPSSGWLEKARGDSRLALSGLALGTRLWEQDNACWNITMDVLHFPCSGRQSPQCLKLRVRQDGHIAQRVPPELL